LRAEAGDIYYNGRHFNRRDNEEIIDPKNVDEEEHDRDRGRVGVAKRVAQEEEVDKEDRSRNVADGIPDRDRISLTFSDSVSNNAADVNRPKTQKLSALS
jgi:hypothetical protein